MGSGLRTRVRSHAWAYYNVEVFPRVFRLDLSSGKYLLNAAGVNVEPRSSICPRPEMGNEK